LTSSGTFDLPESLSNLMRGPQASLDIVRRWLDSFDDTVRLTRRACLIGRDSDETGVSRDGLRCAVHCLFTVIPDEMRSNNRHIARFVPVHVTVLTQRRALALCQPMIHDANSVYARI
jgi:hypothetical protein